MEACVRARQALCHYILSVSVKLVRRPWAALHAFEGSELNMMRAQGVCFIKSLSSAPCRFSLGCVWAATCCWRYKVRLNEQVVLVPSLQLRLLSTSSSQNL